MFEFTLFRIPIRVEPFHWIILFFLGGGIDVDSRHGLINILLFMVAGFFSILVHEMGHALTGRKYGARNAQVILHGMGGVAIFPSARFSRKESFLVTAAGPGIQLLLALVAWLLWREFALVNGVGRFLYGLYFVSLFWALLNCLPVFPLDGGQMLHAILGPQKEQLTLQISIATAIIGGLLMFHLIGSFFFPIIMGFMAWQNWQQLQRISGR